MDPDLHCDFCHGLGPNARGDYIDCTLDATADPLMDADCSVCYDSFEGRETVRHDICRHVFHTDCVNLWAPELVPDAVDGGHQFVTCPMCRQPIRQLNIGPYPKRVLRVPTHDVSQRLLAILGKKPVYPLRRQHLVHIMQEDGHRYPDAQHFYQSRICPADGDADYPTCLIPPGHRPPGSQVFDGIGSIQGGVLEVPACPHVREYILLDPLQYYYTVCDLFSHGWDPSNGTLTGRARPGEVSWLPDLMKLATENPMFRGPDHPWVEISHVEFASAFHNSPAVRFGTRLLMQFYASDTQPHKWHGFIVGFRQSDPQRAWQPLDHASTMRLVASFGGLGDVNIALEPFAAEDLQVVQGTYWSKYSAIQSKFPEVFRLEDEPLEQGLLGDL